MRIGPWDPAHADAAEGYIDFSSSSFTGFNILVMPCIVSPEVTFRTTLSQFQKIVMNKIKT